MSTALAAMRPPWASRPRDRRRRTWAAVVIGSVLLHLLVLGYLAVRQVRDIVFPPGAPPVILIEIEPRPLLDGETAPRPAPLSPAVQQVVTPTGAYAAARPLSDAAPTPRPDQSAPLPSAAAPSPARAVDPLWQVRPETEADRIARSMRAAGIGCHPPTRTLTRAEQEGCDRRLAAAARAAPAARGTGDPERDARFAAQGARELAQYEARRAPLSGGIGITGPADCVGSNLGVGCAGSHLPDVPSVDMRQGADNLIRQPSNKLD